MMKLGIKIEERPGNPIFESSKKGRNSNFALFEINGSIIHEI